MMHFTTFFDINYLSRGLTLINSIKENDHDFTLHILCLDDKTFQFFQNNTTYPQITVIKLEELEDFYPELLHCKEERSTIEYFFTLSPFLPLYILEKYNLSHICSLDADMKFFSSAKPIFNYLQDYSIIITPHKFSKENNHMEIYGKYNVSFQIFKNNVDGRKCLEQWKEQCLDWCKDFLDEQGRFADQKYLDHWHKNFPGKVLSLERENCGLAVWNINNYHIKYENGKFTANNENLIFYHFHHFKVLTNFFAINGFYSYNVKPTIGNIKLYLNYWKSLKKWEIGKKKNSIRNQIYSMSNYKIMQVERSFFIYYFLNIFNVPDITKTKPLQKISWRILSKLKIL